MCKAWRDIRERRYAFGARMHPASQNFCAENASRVYKGLQKNCVSPAHAPIKKKTHLILRRRRITFFLLAYNQNKMRSFIILIRKKLKSVNAPLALVSLLIALALHIHVKKLRIEEQKQVAEDSVYLKEPGGSHENQEAECRPTKKSD